MSKKNQNYNEFIDYISCPKDPNLIPFPPYSAKFLSLTQNVINGHKVSLQPVTINLLITNRCRY